MDDDRRQDERRREAARPDDAPDARRGGDRPSQGYGYGGAGEGYGYGGYGPADRGGRGRAGSVYDPGELSGYGYGGEDAGRSERARDPGGAVGPAQGAGRRNSEDRGFLERAGDEIATWMGDDEARRRKEQDAGHRGKGPRGYRRSDSRILDDVNDRLYDAPHIDASGIEVRVENGEVTLGGTVDSRATKRAAEDCAEAVAGVLNVQNNLRVAAADAIGSGGAAAGAAGSRH